MASGWASDDAVQEQIDSTIGDGIMKARQQLGHGKSVLYCEACGELISENRRRALKGIRYCLTCQEKQDNKQRIYSGYNRRGSKDSQLR